MPHWALFLTVQTAFTLQQEKVSEKQAISAHEWALCQLSVCFEFQSRRDRRKGRKSFALQILFRSNQGNCLGVKSRLKTCLKKILQMQ